MTAVKRFEPWALVVALLFPTLVTWIYFVALADWPSAWQQAAAIFGKVDQFAFPILWVWLILGEPIGWPRWSSRGVFSCVLFGCLVVTSMLLLYHGLFKPSGWFDAATEQAVEKVAGIGISSKWIYAGLGTFYALVHSGLEEYYWRWFVFGRLRRYLSTASAAVISSLGFMAHHVIVLAVYFGWASPMTYFFSGCVAIGGLVWSLYYERTNNLWGPWLSHLVIDAGIFVLGYDVIGHLFA